MFKGIEKYTFKNTPLETPNATPITHPIRVELEKIPEKLNNFKLWIFSIIKFNYYKFYNSFRNL